MRASHTCGAVHTWGVHRTVPIPECNTKQAKAISESAFVYGTAGDLGAAIACRG